MIDSGRHQQKHTFASLLVCVWTRQEDIRTVAVIRGQRNGGFIVPQPSGWRLRVFCYYFNGIQVQIFDWEQTGWVSKLVGFLSVAQDHLVASNIVCLVFMENCVIFVSDCDRRQNVFSCWHGFGSSTEAASSVDTYQGSLSHDFVLRDIFSWLLKRKILHRSRCYRCYHRPKWTGGLQLKATFVLYPFVKFLSDRASHFLVRASTVVTREDILELDLLLLWGFILLILSENVFHACNSWILIEDCLESERSSINGPCG